MYLPILFYRICFLHCFVEQGIPACIGPYCTTGEDLDMAARYRVVVCTSITAGTLYMCGIKAGHFTHVFVDEVIKLAC
jgi:hypothetical protein